MLLKEPGFLEFIVTAGDGVLMLVAVVMAAAGESGGCGEGGDINSCDCGNTVNKGLTLTPIIMCGYFSVMVLQCSVMAFIAGW